jgi:hypothetical protein
MSYFNECEFNTPKFKVKNNINIILYGFLIGCLIFVATSCAPKLPFRKVVIDNILFVYNTHTVKDSFSEYHSPIEISKPKIYKIDKTLYLQFISSEKQVKEGDTILVRLSRSGDVKIMKKIN